MAENKQPRTQIGNLEIEKELTAEEMEKVQGGLLPAVQPTPANSALIGLLLPAVQKAQVNGITDGTSNTIITH